MSIYFSSFSNPKWELKQQLFELEWFSLTIELLYKYSDGRVNYMMNTGLHMWTYVLSHATSLKISLLLEIIIIWAVKTSEEIYKGPAKKGLVLILSFKNNSR